MAKRRIKHGWSQTPEYQAIHDAIARCHKESHESYYLYGALGISVCGEWRDNPYLFCEYIGKKPSKTHSLERIDNLKGYEPGNVEWSTPDKQVRNRKKSRSNTTGFTGVCWLRNQKKNTYAAAWWTGLDGKGKCKTFSVIKFGLIPAYKMACEYRQDMIKQLNLQGAGYSESHGK